MKNSLIIFYHIAQLLSQFSQFPISNLLIPCLALNFSEELAKRLQDEEDRQAAESADSTQQRQQRPQQQQQGGGGEHPTAPPRHQHHQQQDGPHPSSSRQAAGHPGVAPTRDRDRQRSGNKNVSGVLDVLSAEVAGILDFSHFSIVVQLIRRLTTTEYHDKEF